MCFVLVFLDSGEVNQSRDGEKHAWGQTARGAYGIALQAVGWQASVVRVDDEQANRKVYQSGEGLVVCREGRPCMSEPEVLLESNLPGVPLHRRGKVRDVHRVDDALLIVATDRISAFDCILPNGIPGKGRVLTQLSLFWFDLLRDVVPNHLLTADPDKYPPVLQPFRAQLAGRSMLVKSLRMVEVECVARGYLVGSGWKDYQRTGAVCGIALPPGLRDGDRLDFPIFTPASKAATGHDENIDFRLMIERVGRDTAERLRELTLTVYETAAAYAAERGILLADTKLEFGFDGGMLTLGDEVLTPDSSRFWPRGQWRPGGAQPSFDKQFVRDYLEAQPWDKRPPAPQLPPDVVRRTSDKYHEAYRQLTGREL